MKQRLKSFAGIAVCIFIGIAPIVYADWFSRKENQKSARERLDEFYVSKEQPVNNREQDINDMFEDVYLFFNENTAIK